MNNIRLFSLVLAGLMVAMCSQSKAAGDAYYFALPGVSGNVTAGAYAHDIAVTGFQYPGISGSAESFYIEKNFDSASALLLLASVTGTSFTSGTFYCVAGGGEGVGLGKGLGRIFTMVFGDLVIDAWQSADMGTSDPVPTEKVSFSFDSLSITTYPQKGGPGGPPVTTLIFAPPDHN